MYNLKRTFILCLFLTSIFTCQKNRNRALVFAQLCDTQLGMGGYDHDLKSFKQAVKQINNLNPDFVVICGDLVNNPSDSSYRDFQNIKDGFKIPIYLAPGNHDVGNIPDHTSLSYYRHKIGKDYFSFKYLNSNFIVTNTQLWKSNTPNETRKHHDWFTTTLDSLGEMNQKIFVIGHYPLFIESSNEEEGYFNIPEPNRKKILDCLINNNVKAYLSGHTHELLINTYEGILFLSGETTSKNFDKRPLGFRLWKVHADYFEHEFVPIRE
jgi:3',5'-cyclic AMP phosphodiesterase CpdA